MASAPPIENGPAAPSPRHLMALGLFVFGMDTLPYQSLRRVTEWRHAATERHGARPASQYLGPGAESISLSGLCVPELGGSYAAMENLREMADTGDDYTLVDGHGDILGNFRILRIEEEHLTILAGGRPRHKAFTIELERVDG
jgi:hypothetical protein